MKITVVRMLRAATCITLMLMIVGPGLMGAQTGSPGPIAFDGTFIWVADNSLLELVQINTSTGAIVGDVPIACQASDMVYDSIEGVLWVACRTTNQVLKYTIVNRNSTYCSVSSSPFSLVVEPHPFTKPPAVTADSFSPYASDPLGGPNIWVGGSGGITKMRGYNCVVLATYSSYFNVQSLAYDGVHIWAGSTVSSEEGVDGYLTELLAKNGEVVNSYAGGVPTGLTWDGTYLWLMEDQPVIERIDPNNPQLNLDVDTGGNSAVNAVRAVSDGTNLWVVNLSAPTSASSVTKVVESTGAVVGMYTTGYESMFDAFDGVNIWVTNYTSSSVTKLLASTGAYEGTFYAWTRPATFQDVTSGYRVARSGTSLMPARIEALQLH